MNIPTMSPALKTSLVKRGITMFSLAPLVLAAWAIGADHFGWDVVDSARYSAICLIFILAAFILSPLLMPRNKEERRLGFIFYWFTVSTLFNLSWQIPLILFRSTITQAEITHANLYKDIAWWGYGFADAHYGKVSLWMISEEAWWFLAIVVAITGLWKIKTGRATTGFLLLGIAGLLQAYNASLYMVYDFVTGFQNIPRPDWASWLLYWGFNPLWASCALIAGIFSLQIVHRQALASAVRL
ncbi:MAG TPA: hypothetical protein PLI90_11350 [Rhodocyclaceae bacterium]|nr:hypothetical protein [Rhodocyclaceae bacterium]